MNTINKTTEKIIFDTEKDRFVLRRITKQYRFDEVNDHRLGKNPLSTTEQFLELDALEGDQKLLKKITIPILLIKIITDRETLTNLEGYFKQELIVSVLSDDAYRFKFLSLSNGRIWVHDLDADYTSPLILSGGDHSSGLQSGIQKKFVGEPKRLTTSEAYALKKQGCPLFEKQGDQYNISLGTFKE